MLTQMLHLASYYRYFWRNEKGATAVEYGIMVALIAAFIILIVAALGSGLWDLFDTVVGAIGGTSPVKPAGPTP